MTETSTEWQNEVREALNRLSDIEAQRQAWMSSGRIHFPDALELYLTLLDDLRFSDFVERNLKHKNHGIYAQGIEILRLLQDITDEQLSDSVSILDNSNWQRAANLSARLVSRLDEI